MKLYERLRCFGFHGFGGGWLMAEQRLRRVGAGKTHELYCSAECPRGQECWGAHRERVRQILPALTEVFDGIAAEHDGDPSRMYDAWAAFQLGEDPQATIAPDPYIRLMTGNMEDGVAVRETGKPVDRAEYTIPYPFPGK